MLRIERIFEAEGVADELEACNPLIPDGSNWKVTLLIEFPEVEQRRTALAQMKGIEDRCWVRVAGHDRVLAIADEDLERENDEKTSSVHFLRFELTPAMLSSAKGGAAISIGMDHDAYRHATDPLPQAGRDALDRVPARPSRHGVTVHAGCARPASIAFTSRHLVVLLLGGAAVDVRR